VAWEDSSTLDGEIGVGLRGQIFDVTGNAVGADFHINSKLAGYQAEVSIAALSNGNFAVAYTDAFDTGDGSGPGVRTRIFDASGHPVSRPGEDPSALDDIFANATKTNGQVNPTVVAMNGGGYAVFFEDNSSSADDPNATLRGRFFNADGTPASDAEFLIPQAGAAGSKFRPTAAVLVDGKFVVAWEVEVSTGPGTSTKAVHGRIFNADGTPASDDLLMNQGEDAIQSDPQVIALMDGGFAIAYGSQSNTATVHIATFTGTGAFQGNIAVEMPEMTDLVRVPSLSALADGRLVVSWTDQNYDTGSYGTHAQIFDPRTSAINLAGTGQNDHYIGTAFNDILGGSAGNDRLEGADGADVLNGGIGVDTLIGGNGNDIYYVDSTSDVVTETATGGTADLVYSSASYTLAAYVEKLTAIGSSAISLTGNTLSNTITGNAAANRIYGNNGNDTLYGGKGNDVLYGGTGKDTFVFNTTPSSTSNKDKIADWNYKDDTIYLENAVFKALKKTGALSKYSFVKAAKALDSNDYVGYDSKTGNLWYDSNGNKSGGQVIFANIGAKKPIYYTDFHII
jgi:Ca2+-binding RTX toxin-like protein